MAPEKFDVSNFYHVKKKISLSEGTGFAPKMILWSLNVYVDDSYAGSSSSTRFIRRLNPETKATLDTLSKEYKPPSSIQVSALVSICNELASWL